MKAAERLKVAERLKAEQRLKAAEAEAEQRLKAAAEQRFPLYVFFVQPNPSNQTNPLQNRESRRASPNESEHSTIPPQHQDSTV